MSSEEVESFLAEEEDEGVAEECDILESFLTERTEEEDAAVAEECAILERHLSAASRVPNCAARQTEDSLQQQLEDTNSGLPLLRHEEVVTTVRSSAGVATEPTPLRLGTIVTLLPSAVPSASAPRDDVLASAVSSTSAPRDVVLASAVPSASALRDDDAIIPCNSTTGGAKRSNSSEPEDEEDDIVRRYMRECDQKYGYDKADPGNPPLHTLRRGHLCVTDLTGALWCEQQLVYQRCLPARVRAVALPQPAYVTAGAAMHRERELQIQSYVPLAASCKEDSFAVEYSNTLQFVRRILTERRSVVREVSVFGEINGVPIFGVIDELRVASGADFAIDLIEFKTRNNKKPPKASQKLTHEAQVMLYKYLFDDMIRGRCIDHHIEQMGYDLDKELGDDMSDTLQKQCTSQGAGPFTPGATWTLRRLLWELRSVMAALPFISCCLVCYSHQGDGGVFHQEPVLYREEWLLSLVGHRLQFWLGERGCEGVDVEEAWKCTFCSFQDDCSWIKHKSQQLQQRNAQRNKMNNSRSPDNNQW